MTAETWPEMRRRHRDERNAAIVAAVAECGGNQTEAARLLKMHRAFLNRVALEQGLMPKRQWATKSTERREDWHSIKR